MKCGVCTKTVYATEVLKADGLCYHRGCFRCTQCKCTLKPANFTALDGSIYCKPHFKQLLYIQFAPLLLVFDPQWVCVYLYMITQLIDDDQAARRADMTLVRSRASKQPTKSAPVPLLWG